MKKIRKLFFVLTIIVTLSIGFNIGLCVDVEDPEPWSTGHVVTLE